MLILPIKKKWFDMILSGEKKEEYREIKPYYTTRFANLLGLSISGQTEEAKRLLLKSQDEKRGVPCTHKSRTGRKPVR